VSTGSQTLAQSKSGSGKNSTANNVNDSDRTLATLAQDMIAEITQELLPEDPAPSESLTPRSRALKMDQSQKLEKISIENGGSIQSKEGEGKVLEDRWAQ